MRTLTCIALVLLAPLSAGCIASDDVETAALGDVTGEVLATPIEAALWHDPQQFPHPAWNWPTVTNVPAAAPEWWQPIAPRLVPEPIAGFELKTPSGCTCHRSTGLMRLSIGAGVMYVGSGVAVTNPFTAPSASCRDAASVEISTSPRRTETASPPSTCVVVDRSTALRKTGANVVRLSLSTAART